MSSFTPSSYIAGLERAINNKSSGIPPQTPKEDIYYYYYYYYYYDGYW
jgi:hypothetical protein